MCTEWAEQPEQTDPARLWFWYLRRKFQDGNKFIIYCKPVILIEKLKNIVLFNLPLIPLKKKSKSFSGFGLIKRNRRIKGLGSWIKWKLRSLGFRLKMMRRRSQLESIHNSRGYTKLKSENKSMKSKTKTRMRKKHNICQKLEMEKSGRKINLLWV